MIISIVRFMMEYYGVCLNAGCRYSHKKIKKVFSGVRGCSFSYVEGHPDEVKAGKIIYVKDGYGEVLPYYSPNEPIIANEECDFVHLQKGRPNRGILNELSELPTYVLGELLSKYKRKPAIYKIVKEELISRGVYDEKIFKCSRELDVDTQVNDKLMRRRRIRLNNRKGGKND